jgi:hypothetical protein
MARGNQKILPVWAIWIIAALVCFAWSAVHSDDEPVLAAPVFAHRI